MIDGETLQQAPEEYRKKSGIFRKHLLYMKN